MSEIRERAGRGIKAGDSFTVTRRFTEEDMRAFGAITRDYNPIHYDARFSTAKKLTGRICHGLLVASMVTEIGGQIGWLASGMNFRFIRPVHFGDTVTCTLTVTEAGEGGRARAEAVYHNQSGKVVLRGELFGLLPSKAEREVLRSMIAEGDPTNPLR